MCAGKIGWGSGIEGRYTLLEQNDNDEFELVRVYLTTFAYFRGWGAVWLYNLLLFRHHTNWTQLMASVRFEEEVRRFLKTAQFWQILRQYKAYYKLNCMVEHFWLKINCFAVIFSLSIILTKRIVLNMI